MREFALLPASARRDKLSKTQTGEKVPSWVLNEDVTNRITEIYGLYLQKYTVEEIRKRFINPATNLPYSRGQVERDIKRAREMKVHIFRENLEELIEEQIEVHRQLIRDYREQLRLLRAPLLDYNTETRQYESGPGDDRILWTALESKASLEILKAISEEESKIEGLMGFAQQKLMLQENVVAPETQQPVVAIQLNSYGSDSESKRPPVTAKRIIDSSSIFIE